jgi:hypothetical protein
MLLIDKTPLIHATDVGAAFLPNNPAFLDKFVVNVTVLNHLVTAPAKKSRPFPAIVSLDYPDDFAISLSMLRALNSHYKPEYPVPPLMRRHPYYGEYVRFSKCSIGIYKNQPGSYQPDLTQPPLILPLTRGLDIFQPGPQRLVLPIGPIFQQLPVAMIGMHLLRPAKMRLDYQFDHTSTLSMSTNLKFRTD